MDNKVLSPAPTRMHKGSHVCSHFLGKGVVIKRSVGKITRESPGKGVFSFVIVNGNQYPR